MRSFVRAVAFLEQWTVELVREPGLMVTLVIAPFLLLLAFGAGVELGGPKPRTVVVQPADADQSIGGLVERLDHHVDFRGFEESLPLARRSLERGDIDAVIVAPEEPQAFFERGEQVPLQVLIGEIDPLRRSYAFGYLRDQVAALNQRTIEEVVAEAQSEVGNVPVIIADARRYLDLIGAARTELDEARVQIRELRTVLEPLPAVVGTVDNAVERVSFFIPGLSRTRDEVDRLRVIVDDLQQTVSDMESRLGQAGTSALPTPAEIEEIRESLDEVEGIAGPVFDISPAVVSAPFILQMEDVTPIEPTFTAFYSPGVLALLTQHLAVTLAALTFSRVRLLRVVDLLRVAPIRAREVLIGNYLAYGLLCVLAASGLLALMHWGLVVPVVGSWLTVAAIILLLITVSLGIGFVVSLLSSSAQQATQVAMLILLGSIFFSGFVFPLDRMIWPVSDLAYAFPATFALRSLQDEMLRGLLRTPEDIAILAAAAVVLFLLAVFLMRRELRSR